MLSFPSKVTPLFIALCSSAISQTGLSFSLNSDMYSQESKYQLPVDQDQLPDNDLAIGASTKKISQTAIKKQAKPDQAQSCSVTISSLPPDEDLTDTINRLQAPCRIYLMPGTYPVQSTIKIRSGQTIISLQQSNKPLIPANPIMVNSFVLTPLESDKEDTLLYLQVTATSPSTHSLPDRATITAASSFTSSHLIELEEGAKIDRLALDLSQLPILNGYHCHYPIISHSSDVKINNLLLMNGTPCFDSPPPDSGKGPKSLMIRSGNTGSRNHNSGERTARSGVSTARSTQWFWPTQRRNCQ